MKNSLALRIIFHITLIFLAVCYGLLVAKFQLPPYSMLKAGYEMIAGVDHHQSAVAPPELSTQTPSQYYETDVAALISIRKSEDIREQRDKLTSFLWNKSELPRSLPSDIERGFHDARYQDIEALRRIDKITILMEFGLESIVYHFIPEKSNNKVVLYHQGHDGDFIHGKDQIRQLIDHGYAVGCSISPPNPPYTFMQFPSRSSGAGGHAGAGRASSRRGAS